MRANEKYVGFTPKDYEELGDMHKKVLEIFSNRKNKKILDVGCADGNLSVLLKEVSNAQEVYGIEISEKGVKSAKKIGVKAFQLDAGKEDFPFEDDYFDGIYAGEVIEHLFDPDHLLDEIYRTLCVGGLCVITTPNLASIYNRVALLFGFHPWTISVSLRHAVGHLYEVRDDGHIPMTWAEHIRGFTYRALIELLKIHGFRIIKVKGSHTFSYARLPKNKLSSSLISTIDKAISLFPSLSYRVIVCCSKEGMNEKR